ncbi:hypothetical protein ACBY01_02895 [Sphingomonas sp. ac-8]
MRRRLRIVLFAALAALVSIAFVLPFVRGKHCAAQGGRFDRTTLACSRPG